MGAAWYRAPQGRANWPEVHRLAVALAPVYGLGRYPARWLALGVVDRIWAWASAHAPTGVLPGPPVAASELAEAIDWDRSPDELWAILGASGVIVRGGIEPGSAPPPDPSADPEKCTWQVAHWWREVGADLARYGERAEGARRRKEEWLKRQEKRHVASERVPNAFRTRSDAARSDKIRLDKIRSEVSEVSVLTQNFNKPSVGAEPPPPNAPAPAPRAKRTTARAPKAQLALDHESPTPAPSRLGAFSIVLKNGEKWSPPDSLLDRLKASYPDVDVEADWRNLAAKYACWPENDRKVNGERFFTNWVASTAGRQRAYAIGRPQNNRPNPPAAPAPRPAPGPWEGPKTEPAVEPTSAEKEAAQEALARLRGRAK